jgi:ABC-type uncharacterized transport system substrate-binding protein
MFLTSGVEFVWDKATLQGCWLEWTFDQFFSADLMNYDENGDGSFDAKETRAVFDGAFSNLRNYYYFTFIRQGKVRTNPKTVEKFSVVRRGDRVAYRFFVDLSDANPGEIALAVYDYTFFCDIRSPESRPVTLTYDPSYVTPKYAIVENRDYPVYYNPLGAANDTTIYYSWKKGLVTYYPREIRIAYD